MVQAAERGDLDDYMLADHQLDIVVHQASQNHSAVKCVAPLIVQCRRFWYAYQHEGDVTEGARATCTWRKASPPATKTMPWPVPTS